MRAWDRRLESNVACLERCPQDPLRLHGAAEDELRLCLQCSAGQGRPHPYTSLEISVPCGLFVCCLLDGTQKIVH